MLWLHIIQGINIFTNLIIEETVGILFRRLRELLEIEIDELFKNDVSVIVYEFIGVHSLGLRKNLTWGFFFGNYGFILISKYSVNNVLRLHTQK